MSLETSITFSEEFAARYFQYDPNSNVSFFGLGMDGVSTEGCVELEGVKKVQSSLARKRLKLEETDLEFIVTNLGNEVRVADQLLRQVVEEISGKTNFFRKSSDLTSYVVNQVGQVTMPEVQWDVVCMANGEEAGGLYCGESHLIKISVPRPGSWDYLKSLGLKGSLPYGRKTFDHEVSHSIYHHYKEAGEIISELDEVYAYRVSQNSINEAIVDTTSEGVSKSFQLDDYLWESKLYPHLDDIIRLRSAVWFIDRLEALGMPPLKVMDLIRQPGEWNDDWGEWDQIGEAFGELKHEQGMEDHDVEVALFRYRLESDIDRLRARSIVQNALYAVAEPMFKDLAKEKRWWKRGPELVKREGGKALGKSLLYLGNGQLG